MTERVTRLHAWIRSRPWLRRFTLANRLLLAMAFLPTGMVKLLGRRFTVLPVENPVGFFFEAMYQTGPYWTFIGAVQVIAALCLLVPATGLVGAVLFVPVAVSIFLITWGIGFGNTVYVAGGMVLSVGWLLLWDGHRVLAAIRPMLLVREGAPLLEGAHPIEMLGWGLGGGAGMALFLSTRGLVPAEMRLALLASGGLAAMLVLLGWIVGARRGAG